MSEDFCPDMQIRVDTKGILEKNLRRSVCSKMEPRYSMMNSTPKKLWGKNSDRETGKRSLFGYFLWHQNHYRLRGRTMCNVLGLTSSPKPPGKNKNQCQTLGMK